MGLVFVPMIKVELTNIEIGMGCLIGCGRTIRGKHFKDASRKRKKEKNMSQWHIDIEGACGEIAFAKWKGAYWTGSEMDTFKGGDVGDFQVRHTHLQQGCLIVRPGDKDSDPYALVTGEAPYFVVVGWMEAGEAKQEKWLHGQNTDEPYYRVPQQALTKFGEVTVSDGFDIPF
jgi:hypothetical protein